jgi:peptidyl-tRNA hydrolase, PTH1 family
LSVQIWAGLGNPGVDYAMHRHNAGFMALEAIASEYRFSPWKAKFQGLIAEGRIDGVKILLLKPQTFMNESGRSIGEAMHFYKLDASAVTIFYDELDLAPFKVKVRTGGGSAGHNGIRSTVAAIGEEFRRVRIGIGHPGHKDRVTGHVLGNWAKAEHDDLAHMLGAIAAEAKWLTQGDEVRFMSDVALRLNG